MRGLALIVGNSEYEQTQNNLKNPINDAKDFADKLKNLGYIVTCLTNVNQQDLDQAIADFGKELNKYDIGIFYFAGHGMQIDGTNYLTAHNTNFDSEIAAQYSSITVNKILAYMEKAKNETNIVILDACRDNPFERSWNRSIANQGLAPMYAPKGTLIAYATSPGEKASDGIGTNGLYTSALLNHIDEKNLTIEEFFKRVRNTVYSFSNGKQTSWEHTSLTGKFIFNSGQLIQSVDLPYSDEVVADKNMNLSSENDLIKIVRDLKAHNYYVQSPAIKRIPQLNPVDYTNDELFALGRNILQTASGGEFEANNFMENLPNRLERFNQEDQNHVLNGILFEKYFNSNGIFRNKEIRTSFLPEISNLSNNRDFSKSFDFIETQLTPFSDNLFYIPSGDSATITFNIIFEKLLKDGMPIYRVIDVKYGINSVLNKDEDNQFFIMGEEKYYENLKFIGLKPKISNLSNVPQSKLSLITNYDNEINDDSKVDFPIGYKLEK